MKHPKDGEVRIGQGLEKARQFLIDNPDLSTMIEGTIKSKADPSSFGKGGGE
jgi:hypothetical protein